jgi:hypothetical protein
MGEWGTGEGNKAYQAAAKRGTFFYTPAARAQCRKLTARVDSHPRGFNALDSALYVHDHSLNFILHS